jgi:very-short-patch-repair endonuclease
MRYQWGPLLRDGGERRLNVAATRAKRRLTVVSSFSSHDVDPGRLTKPGARLLAEYLEYAGSGGTPVAASGSDSGLGAFESDVAARLAALGIMVVPQYGVGGYRVDFAAAHPDDPTRMILAVEADGASYRDSRSVRDRDRLRKEHLERLGWRVHRLWSTSWFTDPDAELAKLRAAYAEAVRANPPAPPPPPADPPDPPAAGPSSAGERSSSAAPPATAEPAPAGEPPLTDDPPGLINRPPPAPPVTGATRVPIALPARTVTPVEGPPPSRALPPIPRP